MTRQTLLRVIAVVEVIGGIAGLILTLAHLASGGFGGGELAVGVIPALLFSLALFAGVMLWRDRPIGYHASTAVQLAQLFKIATPQFALAVSFGGDIMALWSERTDAAGRSFRTAGVHSQAGSHCVTEFNRPPGAPQWFGISFISCVALAILRKGRRHAPERDVRPEVAPAPVSAAGEADWVLPVWLKLAVALFALLVASCAGLLIVSR